MEKFRLIEDRFVPTLNSSLITYEHLKTGAKVVYHKCDDVEKSFMIQFRTLPKTDNGICHILEHSVLSGSKKYNVKEPFVNLMKGSLNTFLNAMTFSDKTVYPFSTINEKELLNLMDVYLDAVLFPNIYRDENILAQEGWHYEIDKKGDLFINGVVYNEMKGALSQPEQMMYHEVFKNLYDNVYSVESGGDPKSIPTLNQSEFLDFHKRYYHPSNSVSFLNGKMNIENALNKIDEFFCQFDKSDPAEKILPTKAFEEPRTVYASYPVMKKEKEQCLVGIGIVQGNADNLRDNMGLKILGEVLFSTPISPVRNMLLDSGLVYNIYAEFDDSILQPTLNISIRGVEEDNADTVIESIFFELERLSEEGIDREILQAAINQWKFNIKEGFEDVPMPKGLIFALEALSNIDRGVNPAEKLDIEKYLLEIEKMVEDNYFENLIRKYYLENNHRVNVIMTPDEKIMKFEQEKLKKQMKDLKENLSDKDIKLIEQKFKSLQKRQTTQDSQEEVDKIPKIKSSDIDRVIEKVDYEKIDSIYPLYSIKNKTKGISYINLLFKQEKMSKEKLMRLSFMTSLIGFLGTEKKDYVALNNEVMKYTGGISVQPKIYNVDEKSEVFVQVSIKYLDEYCEKALDLAIESLTSTDFSDENRILNLLNMIVSNMEMSFIEKGNVIAGERLTSYFDEKSNLDQSIYGIDFYNFVKRISLDFDSEKEQLIEDLKDSFNKAFSKEGISLVYQGDDIEGFKDEFNSKAKELKSRGELKDCIKSEHDFKEQKLNEAFIIPSEVNYVAKGYNFKELGYDFKGSMLVVKNIIDTDYLWENIRVKGGAYGCSTVIRNDGSIYCSSYRDPNVVSTLSVFDSISAYLKDLDLSSDDLDRYIVGTVSNFILPINNTMRLEYAQKDIFENFGNDIRQKTLDEILNTNEKDVKDLSIIFDEAMQKNFYCAVGSSKIEIEAQSIFDIKRI